MKRKQELNKKLFLNKKSIAALTPAGTDQVQGGMRPISKDGCASAGCYGGASGGQTCDITLDNCLSGIAANCIKK